MTDTSTLSGAMLDYYAALAENMPNPRLRKLPREDGYSCDVDMYMLGLKPKRKAYNPINQPEISLDIISMLVRECFAVEFYLDKDNIKTFLVSRFDNLRHIKGESKNLTEAALRALVAWKFPDGLPEIVYESEK